MSFEVVPDDLLAEVLAKPEKAVRSGRKKPPITDDRDIAVWFRLPHSLGVCDNPECPDTRPMKVEEGNAMTTLLPDGKRVCRLCYVDGYGLSD